ncbi:TPA: hypothetical protein ACF0M1_002358 [Enterococcus hirae]|uniref:Uncharacterized protein n=2 Tax=Enterococcus hirae TaxID=1354 RepID=G0YP52_ENTHA|nr:hypothetical protein [Enterococcus hirae]AEJ87172.1 hypothetical protein EHR_3010 [Enterococcus hirae ATCC 9790]EOH66948.1 hypothetical protein UAE_02752 [Enterococcus hirae ATCC 9790]EOU03373.1 hypothetical protein I584_02746 [Enterococcus hirae ATCC 9790]OJG49219.1 hypothetical protein RV05_GL001349 [Enterococcus hirae]QQY20824.1 hypothetical protein I6I80_00310 [Enterococcus hirae]
MFEDYFDIDSILSYIVQAPFFSGLDEKAVGALNGLLNILFGIGKSIVLSGNYLIKNVYSVDILNDSIDKVFGSGEQVWDSIFKTFGVVFLSILFVYAVRDLLKFGIEKIFMRLLIFGSLVVVATGFYSSGSKWLKDINTISSDMQNELVSVMAPDISKDTDKLASDLGLTPPTETTDKIENMLYYRFVLEPFALFNYGKTDISKKDYTELTAKKGKYDDEVDDIEDKVEDNSKKNAYLTGKKLGDKYLILLNSGIDYVIVAGVILLISVMNFLAQIFILALVLISPIWVALALLPDNEHVLMNGMKLILGSFGLKIALGVGFGFIFMILDFIDSAFGLTSITAIVASLIIKIILAFLVIKNFHWFKNAITKAEVDHVPDMKLKKQGLDRENKRKELNPDNYTGGGIGNTGGFSNREGYGNNAYADNVQLQSALDDDTSDNRNFGEHIMRGMGYVAGRGVGNAVADKIGDKAKDLYEDSKLQNVVDTTKSFANSPSDYLKERVSPYTSAYTEGNLEGLNKTYGIGESENQDIRMNESEEEENKEQHVQPVDPNEFEQELASLRGEEVSEFERPVNVYDQETDSVQNFDSSNKKINHSHLDERVNDLEHLSLSSVDRSEVDSENLMMEREEELNENDS